MFKYKMNFHNDNIWLACFFLTVFTTLVAVNASNEERVIDLKLGFDLTRGENGAPALRIRAFEDSLVKPRAEDDELNEGEDSSSKESTPMDNVKSAELSDKHNEDDFSADNDEDDDDDDGYKKHVTRGLSGNVDPEERPGLHDRADEDDEDSRRRRKRSAGDYISKRKNKKYGSARKLMAPFLKMLRQ